MNDYDMAFMCAGYVRDKFNETPKRLVLRRVRLWLLLRSWLRKAA